jgi:hypothetical protein
MTVLSRSVNLLPLALVAFGLAAAPGGLSEDL